MPFLASDSKVRVGWQVCSLMGGPTSVPFCTNGTFIVTGSEAGLVKIWNAQIGAEVRSIYLSECID